MNKNQRILLGFGIMGGVIVMLSTSIRITIIASTLSAIAICLIVDPFNVFKDK